ncbi:Uu.00g082990.m01.CDS01 [Anthostomella pinea]|uniref:Uu.00g082990.m01.CDS01 n=1 Tax=Anthostomella pinea TaxID=933095 RepID=A0AAI8YJP6_9PEZI|nr:Uu.00g082990.m01.CDS01 [Anthostomella pinea]
MKPSDILISLSGLCCVASGAAVPGSKSQSSVTEKRQLVGGLLSDVLGLLNLRTALGSGNRNGVLRALEGFAPKTSPTSVAQASAVLEAITTSSPTTLPEFNARMITNGIISGSVGELFNFAQGTVTAENSKTNSNPNPPTPVYPKVEACDAPYSVSEASLRAAIYIPNSFTYGRKPPVILFPGTGSTGYVTFIGNFIPLLSNVDYADPVWVNVPGNLLDDAQVNAEYAAYALNYIAALTCRNVSIIAWSQGNIDTQWAFKYWPSTRNVTSDHVAVSADYKGTIFADFADVTGVTNDPAVLQQEAGSNFIRALRSNGGDSGYVPTTSIYSGFFDEIVEPQQGTGASAFLLDARGVGVTNSEAQVVCNGQVAGSFYTHESLLASPLTFALAKDALTHDGPGLPSRLDLGTVCSTYLAPGLGLDDFLLTENAILVSGLSLVLYLPKVASEPPLMPYVTT